MSGLRIVMLSPLEKVFPDKEPLLTVSGGSMLLNEVLHFSFAIYNENNYCRRFVKLRPAGPLKDFVAVKAIGFVPAVNVSFSDSSDNYFLTKQSGIFPDVLEPADADDLMLPGKKWTGYFVTVDFRGKAIKPGSYEIGFNIFGQGDAPECSGVYRLRIIDAYLPENNLKVTQWIHYDCICRAHGTEVFSPEFWKITGEYFRAAVKHGQTMVLTPLFTFPLDTKEGGERPAFQLVGIKRKNRIYEFDFALLDKFIDSAFGCGFKYIEFSHLFTQWGGLHAPKIMAEDDGEYKKIFGWETDSTGEEYTEFLNAFLPELKKYAINKGLKGRCFFHLTDEPRLSHMATYRRLSETVRPLIDGFPVMDAISNFEFSGQGLIDYPVVALEHTVDFEKNNIAYYVYYCCDQEKEYVSNRFLAMPAQRNRILGFQLYLNGVEGFLHWGFNFYSTQFSTAPVDPYRITDAGGGFPAGDAFIVYPGNGEVKISPRLAVFFDGIQDYLALKALESKIGRDKVMQLLKKEGMSGFRVYPKDAAWHIGFREKINALLAGETYNGDVDL